MHSLRRSVAWTGGVLLLAAGLAPGSSAAAKARRGSDGYEVVFSRSTVTLADGVTQTLMSAEVPEQFIVDMVGRPALEACTRSLTDDWASCLCRRTGWESIQVQKEQSGLTYHLMRWDGRPGTPTPYAWNVGRPDGTAHGLEIKVVPFE